MPIGLAIVGMSILGTWGAFTIAMIAGGIILIAAPGDIETTSSGLAGGLFLLIAGLISGGAMQTVLGPLLGIDPPLPLKAKDNIPHDKMKFWENAGSIRNFPEGVVKEVRLRTVRVAIIRVGETAHALGALCPHVRLPIGSFPGMPLKPEKIRDECVTCPFHGARFEITTGKAVTQPFTSEFNAAHPFLGRLQSKILFWNKGAEDIQTYPVKIENENVIVGLPR